MTEPVEFDCVDCGIHVYAFGCWDKDPRCLTCKWINMATDPVEKMKLRAFLTNEEDNDEFRPKTAR